MEISTSSNFIGTVDELPEAGKIGDVVLKSGSTYIWTGSWNKLTDADVSMEFTSSELVKLECPMCSGQLQESESGYMCPYCGSKFKNKFVPILASYKV